MIVPPNLLLAPPARLADTTLRPATEEERAEAAAEALRLIELQLEADRRHRTFLRRATLTAACGLLALTALAVARWLS